MPRQLINARQSVLSKLFVGEAFILLVIGGIVAVNWLSFEQVERLVTAAIRSKMTQVIGNARLSRDLNRFFAEMNLFLNRFMEEPDLVETEGPRLLDVLTQQTRRDQTSHDTRLHAFLSDYEDIFETLLAQAAQIADILQQTDTLHREMERDVTTLENMLSEKMLLMAIQAHDQEMFTLEQLTTMTPEYRYAMAQFSLLMHKTLKMALTETSVEQTTRSQFAQLLDDFTIHLAAITMAEGEFTRLGEQLAARAQTYKQQILALYEAVQHVRSDFFALGQAQQRVAEAMARIDSEVFHATETFQQELVSETHASQRSILILSAIILIVLLLVGGYAFSVIRPLVHLATTAAQLAHGDLSVPIPLSQRRDEIGVLARSFREIIAYLRRIADIAQHISDGNLHVAVEPRSSKDALSHALQRLVSYIQDVAHVTDNVSKKHLQITVTPRSEHDVLNHALQRMVTNLRRMVEDSERQSWLKDGINQLNKRLSGDMTLDVVCETAIHFTARHVNAGRGVLYVYDEEQDMLHLRGTYAFTDQDQRMQQCAIGESVIGQVAQERSPLLLKHLTLDQRMIRSGTIQEAPLQTLTLPLVYNMKLYGVLELASYEAFDDATQEFLFQAALVIATALALAFQKTQRDLLLQRAQEATENAQQMKDEAERQAQYAEESNLRLEEQQQQLQQQNEEFSQLNAQLKAQQRQLQEEMRERQAIEDTMIEERRLIQRVIDLLPDYVYAKDRDSRFILANQSLVTSAGFAAVEELLGKTDVDFQAKEAAEHYYEDEQALMRSDQAIHNKEETVDNHETGAKTYLLTTKLPFHDRQGNIAGLIGIGRDITELKIAQDRLQRLQKDLEHCSAE